MNLLDHQVKIDGLVRHLQEKQSEFAGVFVPEYFDLKPFLTMDVCKDEIIMYVDVNKDIGFTLSLKTDYRYGELVGIEFNYIEFDSYEYGNHEVQDIDTDALLHECKRLIHNAVHYKLLSEDDAIETDFYREIYA